MSIDDKIEQLVSARINKKPTKDDYECVEIIKKLGSQGFIYVYYKGEIFFKVKVIKGRPVFFLPKTYFHI